MSVEIGQIGQLITQYLDSKNYSSVFLIADTETKKYCYPLVKAVLPKHHICVIPHGEHFKTLDTCQTIWQTMTDRGLDRHALVLNLGGGVIGDMGGFCAATYKRGVDFVQIPTTLLAQVDASVGGKLGIDFNGLKNHIGSFSLPNAVLIDPAFLHTLPAAELRSGFAEIIKHCLIGDADMWNTIRFRDLNEQQLPELIAHSVAFKKSIVAQDPTENGLRKILNFGHTLGHAVESFYLNTPNRLLHGEAIAIGMITEAYLSFKRKLISETLLMQIEEYLFATYGSVKIDHASFDEIVSLTLQDKKNIGKDVRFSLLNGPGSCAFDIVVSAKDMKEALGYYVGGF